MRHLDDACTSTGTHSRTTREIEDDVLAAAKEMTSWQRLSGG
jgi:hypothetical protein